MSFRPLSCELQSLAEKELNEVPSRIPEDLQTIKDWLEDQPHLNARTDDQWLLSFLRGCKYSLGQTKEKLDLFYTMRTHAFEFFGNRDPFLPEIQELLEYGTCLPLPKSSDPASRTTLLIRHKAVDTKKIHLADVLKLILMTEDILMREDDNFVVAGVVSIDDVKDISLSHLLQLTPKFARKVMTCFLNAYPVRPKQIHFLNTSAPFETAYKVAQFFMTEKIKNRVNIYSRHHTENLKQLVPAEILPTEYGGTAGPLSVMVADWKAKVESYRDWFLEDSQYRSDESKRAKKHRTCELS